MFDGRNGLLEIAKGLDRAAIWLLNLMLGCTSIGIALQPQCSELLVPIHALEQRPARL